MRSFGHAALAASLALVACAPKRPISSANKQPAFQPGPPLGPEPSPDPDLPARSWFEAVHAKIHPFWADGFLEQSRLYLPPDHALNNQSLEAVVEFRLNRDGVVEKRELTKPSGNADFDRAALDISSELSVLPPPPQELCSDDGSYYLSWVFARDRRQDGIATARLEKQEWELDRAVPMLLSLGRVRQAAQRLATEAGRMATEAASQGAHAKALVRHMADIASQAIKAALVDASDPATQLEAVRVVRVLRLGALSGELAKLAKGAPSLELQREATMALGDVPTKDAIRMLTEMAKSSEGDRASAAWSSLARLGQRKAAWDHFKKRLAEDPRTRVGALLVVADLAEPESAPTLISLLGNKGLPRGERVLAAQALAELAAQGNTPSTRALGNALSDGDASIRAAAARAIARAGQDGLRSKALFYALAPLYRDPDPGVRAAAMLATARVAPASAKGDLLLLIKKEKHAEVLATGARALGRVPGSDIVGALITLASGDMAPVRMAAIEALSLRAEGEAREFLAKLASDPSVEIRILATGTLTDATALATAATDSSPEVRARAIRTLVKLNGPVGTLSEVAEALAATTSTRELLLISAAWLEAAGHVHEGPRAQ